jgi:hypothetical protein
MQRLVIVAALVVLVLAPAGAAVQPIQLRLLDGNENNVRHPEWGRANTQYLRVARPNYADNVGTMVTGPPTRYVSNRVFNDVGQNLFSENDVSQWGWAWGQFLDHDFGLRDETPAESSPIAFSASDPLEFFANSFPGMSFARTPAAPGTGTSSPRQQINTISSYIDASNVYGVTPARLDWLRAGSADGNPANNDPQLLLTSDGYLPRVDARGNPASAPPMDLMGALMGAPQKAVVAGDVRANENIALTAIHTLMAREHNRIVAALPASLSAEDKFQIARRLVNAEEQYITYNEFLPALGVRLNRYRGYSPFVNAGLANEFAVVGYRAHSMIHGQFEPIVPPGTYSDGQLAAFQAEGITVEDEDGQVKLEIPLTVPLGNPDLLPAVGLGPALQSLSGERQYRNDEQIDNSLRSVLFQVPSPDTPDPTVCGQPVIDPSCFTGVQDLGAIDIERGRDHGMPAYNQLRQAYGLSPKRSFTDLTDERTDRFPNDPAIDPTHPIDDPNSLDFVELRDKDGSIVPLGSPDSFEEAVTGVRRTTLAARLKAIYGDVDKVDAFVGMVSERHVRGSEFGELQLAIWTRQFESLRDGDRFFYLDDPALPLIRRVYGIDYRHTLSELITLNTGVTVQPNVFKAT